LERKKTNLLEYFNWIQEKNNPPHYPGGIMAFIADLFVVKCKPLNPKNMSNLFYKQNCIYNESCEFRRIKDELTAYRKSIEKQVIEEYTEVQEQKKRMNEALKSSLDSLPLLVKFIKLVTKDRSILIKDLLELRNNMTFIVENLDIYLQLKDEDIMRRLGIKKVDKYLAKN
jgi:hypothetical protein